MRKQIYPGKDEIRPSGNSTDLTHEKQLQGAKSAPPMIKFTSISGSSINTVQSKQPAQLQAQALQREEESNKFYGKYRATVLNNLDPMQAKRLQVQVPAVLGDEAIWAVCGNSVYTGERGDEFPLPAPGDNIYIEFEAGDPQYPIWF